MRPALVLAATFSGWTARGRRWVERERGGAHASDWLWISGRRRVRDLSSSSAARRAGWRARRSGTALRGTPRRSRRLALRDAADDAALEGYVAVQYLDDQRDTIERAELRQRRIENRPVVAQLSASAPECGLGRFRLRGDGTARWESGRGLLRRDPDQRDEPESLDVRGDGAGAGRRCDEGRGRRWWTPPGRQEKETDPAFLVVPLPPADAVPGWS